MKEEDLKKHLDNILIDGLIKEAEQDNADFEAAMRKISDESFDEIVMEPVEADCECLGGSDDDMVNPIIAASEYAAEPSERAAIRLNRAQLSPQKNASKFKLLRPWISSIASAAAIILIVLIPSINSMNNKLCDSALYASQAYISPSKGGLDLSTASTDDIKAELPDLVARYEASCKDGRYTEDFPDAAWQLAVAYLKLHRKGDAVKVLKTLEAQTSGTPMGEHCKKLLEQLD